MHVIMHQFQLLPVDIAPSGDCMFESFLHQLKEYELYNGETILSLRMM